MSPLVSVIVPIYKAERYLAACIESLQKQTLKDIEIILVNDGSPDGCLAICQEYAALDTRIKVIDKANGGVSAARNDGINLAQGQYVGYVDPDDKVEAEMYEQMLEAMLAEAADISMCNYSEDTEAGSKPVLLPFSGVVEQEAISEEIVARIIASPDLSKSGNIMGSACRLLIKKALLDNFAIRFPDQLPLMEDLVFCVAAFLKANRVVVLEGAYYRYQRFADSATTVYKKNIFATQRDFFARLKQVLQGDARQRELAAEMDMRYISLAISAISNEMNSGNPKSLREKLAVIKAICTDASLEQILTGFDTGGYTLRKRLVLQAMKHKRYDYLAFYYQLLNRLMYRHVKVR